MRAIIADDEIHLAEDLRRRLQQLWPELQIVAILHDGLAAAAALQQYQPDIAFFDIRMPGQSGLDAARAAPSTCRIVFVTAYDEHAIQAFEHAAVDYLLKPASDERLAQCVTRLQQGHSKSKNSEKNSDDITPEMLIMRLQAMLGVVTAIPSTPPATLAVTSMSAAAQNGPDPAPLRWLRIQVGQSVKLVSVDDVCYFQSTDKYTAVITADAELLLRTPLKELLAQLDPQYFWQVHRASVVNVRKIISAHFEPSGKVFLRLHDRTERVAVSQSYAPLFKQM